MIVLYCSDATMFVTSIMYFFLYWILLCSFSLSSVNKDNKTLCQCCSLQLYYLRFYCRVSLCAIAPCRYSQRFRKSSDLLTQFQIQIQICRHNSRFQICRHNSRFQICRHNLRSLDTVPDLQTLSLDLYKYSFQIFLLKEVVDGRDL